MKRWIWVLILVILVGAVGYFGYTTYQEQQAAAEEATLAAEAPDDLDNVVWASGTLLPRTLAELSPMQQGAVSAIHATEGAWVETGDLLIELDNAVLRRDVESAEAAWAEAKAALDKLLADAAPADIAAARADVAAAQAAVSQAAGAMMEAQAAIDSAEALAEMARREYSELASHPTAAEATAADAEVAIAEANVAAARAAYNLVRGNPKIRRAAGVPTFAGGDGRIGSRQGAERRHQQRPHAPTACGRRRCDRCSAGECGRCNCTGARRRSGAAGSHGSPGERAGGIGQAAGRRDR